MNKKNIKKFSVFILFLFFQYSFAVDDSDIFVEAVFFTAVKKSNYEKVIEMIERVLLQIFMIVKICHH